MFSFDPCVLSGMNVRTNLNDSAIPILTYCMFSVLWFWDSLDSCMGSRWVKCLTASQSIGTSNWFSEWLCPNARLDQIRTDNNICNTHCSNITSWTERIHANCLWATFRFFIRASSFTHHIAHSPKTMDVLMYNTNAPSAWRVCRDGHPGPVRHHYDRHVGHPSADGRLLCTAMWDQTVRICDVHWPGDAWHVPTHCKRWLRLGPRPS